MKYFKEDNEILSADIFITDIDNFNNDDYNFEDDKNINIQNVVFTELKDLSPIAQILLIKRIYNRFNVLDNIYNFSKVNTKDKYLLSVTKDILNGVINNIESYDEKLLDIINVLRKVIYVLTRRLYIYKKRSN